MPSGGLYQYYYTFKEEEKVLNRYLEYTSKHFQVNRLHLLNLVLLYKSNIYVYRHCIYSPVLKHPFLSRPVILFLNEVLQIMLRFDCPIVLFI